MGRTYDTIDSRLAEWLTAQPVFFVASAPLAGDGMVNCSPKGNRGELAVVGPRTVAYLDQTGSGVETIAHVRENARVTLMWCAFDGPPRIVRIHGSGRVVHPSEPEFETLSGNFRHPDGPGVRAVVVVEARRISDSCGYGVPLMTFVSHRATMDDWAQRKGVEGIAAYQAENNARSLDGLTGLD